MCLSRLTGRWVGHCICLNSSQRCGTVSREEERWHGRGDHVRTTPPDHTGSAQTRHLGVLVEQCDFTLEPRPHLETHRVTRSLYDCSQLQLVEVVNGATACIRNGGRRPGGGDCSTLASAHGRMKRSWQLSTAVLGPGPRSTSRVLRSRARSPDSLSHGPGV